MDRNKLAATIYDIAHLTGAFKLRSGVISDRYFDKYRFESDPVVLEAIADALVPLVPTGTEFLAGLELGGVPIATALSRATGLPALFVRKKAKDYGTCKLAEGPDFAGRKLLIVEDVVTSGGAVLDAERELRAAGAVITRVVCVIDRESGGVENLAVAGLDLVPLFRMSELEAAAGAATG